MAVYIMFCKGALFSFVWEGAGDFEEGSDFWHVADAMGGARGFRKFPMGAFILQ